MQQGLDGSESAHWLHQAACVPLSGAVGLASTLRDWTQMHQGLQWQCAFNRHCRCDCASPGAGLTRFELSTSHIASPPDLLNRRQVQSRARDPFVASADRKGERQRFGSKETLAVTMDFLGLLRRRFRCSCTGESLL